MIFKFLRKLGAAGSAEEDPTAGQESVEYKGFTIYATPRRKGSEWMTMGVITKEIDGETRRHEFIRVDTHHSKEAATEFSLVKARQIVDEQGEAVLRKE